MFTKTKTAKQYQRHEMTRQSLKVFNDHVVTVESQYEFANDIDTCENFSSKYDEGEFENLFF